MRAAIKIIPALTARQQVNFWKKVNKDGPVPDPDKYGDIGNCWDWTACKISHGYGLFNVGGELFGTHRIAFAMSGEVLSEDKPYCLHICDRPSCCRSSHLFAGTIADNSSDMTKKGRSIHGERNGSSKLTTEKVIEIRIRYAAGGISQRKLASEYEVTHANIGYIIRRKKWTHIPTLF